MAIQYMCSLSSRYGLICLNLNCLTQENIPIEEVFENLQCTRKGLSSDDVKEWLDLFGYNKLEDKRLGKKCLLYCASFNIQFLLHSFYCFSFFST